MLNILKNVPAPLCCPECAGELKEEETGSRLDCVKCGKTVPIVGGVPRFAEENYVAGFGRQWNRYDVARGGRRGHLSRQDRNGPALLAGKLVLDAGCGGGRYALLLSRIGARVIGVDLSSAVNKAASLCLKYPETLIIQADLCRLPLARECFDVVFSIGVLHHGPNPRRAFAEIATRVAPGGAWPFGFIAATPFLKNGSTPLCAP